MPFPVCRQAKELGVELLVQDDGWFGKRNDDNAGLGNWFVNRSKLPDGLEPLIAQTNDMGVKFGLWMEPEMVNKDSDLYRAHPDWTLIVPGRKPAMSRKQLVLDLCCCSGASTNMLPFTRKTGFFACFANTGADKGDGSAFWEDYASYAYDLYEKNMVFNAQCCCDPFGKTSGNVCCQMLVAYLDGSILTENIQVYIGNVALGVNAFAPHPEQIENFLSYLFDNNGGFDNE